MYTIDWFSVVQLITKFWSLYEKSHRGNLTQKDTWISHELSKEKCRKLTKLNKNKLHDHKVNLTTNHDPPRIHITKRYLLIM